PHTFFYIHPLPHRDLHSFPTRRSSDLGQQTEIERIDKDNLHLMLTQARRERGHVAQARELRQAEIPQDVCLSEVDPLRRADPQRDRKSTRLNSSHLVISYAVFCLKKKK